MAVDIWRLSALVGDLMGEGEDFDPAVAHELFDALPEERSSRLKVEYSSTTTTRSAEGETNAGRASFEETEEKHYKFGHSKGTYVGNWRLTKEKGTITIEPKFHNHDKDFYELRFGANGVIEFMKSHYKHFKFIVTFSIPIMKPWKTMRTS